MQTNEIYLIFLTYVSTQNPTWFHAFEPSQQKVRDYVTIHNTVPSLVIMTIVHWGQKYKIQTNLVQ